MPDKDPVKPYHAKDTAPGQEAADVVAEVLQHAADREEAARQKTVPKGPPKWMLPTAVNLGLLALYFLIAQPEFLVVNPVDDPRGAAEVDETNRNTIYTYGILAIEGYRERTGALPASLAEAGSMLANGTQLGFETQYTPRPDSTYLLVVRVGESELRFDSAVTDPEDFPGLIELGG